MELFSTDRDYKSLYTPGSIQPHGVLLALSEPELLILQVSNNTQTYLGRKPQDLLAQPLSFLFDPTQVEVIKQYLLEDFSGVNYLKLFICTDEDRQFFDGFIHRTKNSVILELEPTDSSAQVTFGNVHNLVKEAIAKLKRTSTLQEFLQLAAQELRIITAFERVMVYQFDQHGAGEVIAEAKQEEVSPYLGLHYPATDIPEQARELYRRGLVRVIPNLKAQAIELVAIENYETHSLPLDLSLSVFRSVHPCCVEFHQNMGTAAIVVISLIKDEKLWGLISCHHQTPKNITSEVRSACEFLGQFISSELANKVIQEEVHYKAKLESLRSEVIESISQADDFIDALVQPEPRLLDLVGAKGAAVCLDGEITLVGSTPEVEDVWELIDWANTQVRENLFYTDSLSKLYPKAKTFKDTASGLLLLQISKVKQYYILWFRPEVLRTVNWAGNPNESIKVEADGSVTLCPRQSFEQWQQTVRFTSEPWKLSEIDSAFALRNAIVGIVLKKAEELAKLNQELERSNQELASFAYASSHDLKEPLRGIYNYSTILLEDYACVLDEDGIEYLQTVVSLSVRMETLINTLLRLSQLGKAEINLQATNLNQLLNEVINVFDASRQQAQFHIHIPRPLPTVQCDSVLMGEVFSNLIANALKYNDRAEKWVEIGYVDEEEWERGRVGEGSQRCGRVSRLGATGVETRGKYFSASSEASLHLNLLASSSQSPITFYVKDNGIGIQKHHLETIFKLFKRLHSQEKYGGGTGAGLAITKKIIERHGGRIWVESSVGEGSTFYFTLE
ncbi:ATP-binding protein [Chlorogloeopsis fritschii PCC 9212]|uniref:histidine kinase n=1 Tax=Chlorogloeopsis fritschii PCC 6912 TaxID=211165 RepID=A0A3S0Y3C4_CHLFR|nr:ATP-binding protein [Chlorogloeopsis fritschii]RUR84463.1 histidine kinase [Chlorogloeopsis fritschii PCC 6912]